MTEVSSGKTVQCRTIPVEVEKKEVSVEELSFRPSVYGVVIKEGAVLLVPQWDGYDFPGGGVHLGEPILEALKRECKEETGYDVEPGRVLHVQDDMFIHPSNDKAYHTVLIYYACTVVGGDLSDAGFTESERAWSKQAKWVPLAEAEKAKFMNPIDSVALLRAIQNI